MTVFRSCAWVAMLWLLVHSGLAVALSSNKWRLECSGNAESAGTISLRLTPTDGAPIDVDIAIAQRTGENAVARSIRDALKADSRVTERYRVEVDDGEDVLIKKRRGQPNFALEVRNNTVKGVRLNRDRE